MKTDQAPAIEYLVKDIVLERGNEVGCRTIVEESPVGSKGSNGVAERAVQEVEGQVRVMKLALESRIGRAIDAESCVVTFLAEYAAYLINRLLVGKDGKTAYERNKGKSASVLGLEFGEKVLYRKKAKTKMDKINSRWAYGIFVGVRPRSGELWVATPEGVKKVRSVRRVPMEDRWSEDSVKWVRHVPWHLYRDQVDADGDIPEEKAVQPKDIQHEAPHGLPQEPVIVLRTRKVPPRAFQIRKEDAEKHGYTRGCAGCSSWFRGLGRQPHTAECRARFAELMKDEARFQNAEKRKTEFEERLKEKEQRKRQRREAGRDGTRAAASGSGSQQDALAALAPGLAMRSSDVAKRERDPEGAAQAVAGDDGGQESAETLKKKARESEAEDALQPEEMETDGAGSDGVEKDGMEVSGVELWEDIIDVTAEDEVREVFQMAADRSWAWDDVHGGYLDELKVAEARREEVGYMMNKGIWREVDEQECWNVTGGPPVTVKWVDTNKGSEDSPIIRSRLVARDFKQRGDKDRQDLFAATPPLEMKRMLISRAATIPLNGRMRKLLFIDVKKAHLNPLCEQDVYFKLPEEVNPGVGKCGKLIHWLYGFRPAAQAWESHYASKLVEIGFRRGPGASVAFYHPQRDLACVVHGDDFTFCGPDEELDWAQGKMQEWYEIKIRGRLGPDEGDDKEVSIIGRVVRWRSWGLEYMADPRHRVEVMEYFGLTGDAKGLSTTGRTELVEDDDSEVEEDEATAFRAVAARVNFLAQDRPDLQFAAKEACRSMSCPTRNSWASLKRLARYLVSHVEAIFKFPWQDEGQSLVVFSDSDWAGCRRTRKSTSGGAVMLGEHCLKTWSSTQGPTALSSAEAEYYSMVEAVTRAKAIQTYGAEIGIAGIEGSMELRTDASAAKSFAARKGLGRQRHIDTRYLWLQEEVAHGRVRLSKVRGDANPADLMTKFLVEAEVVYKAGLLGVRVSADDPKLSRPRGGVGGSQCFQCIQGFMGLWLKA